MAQNCTALATFTQSLNLFHDAHTTRKTKFLQCNHKCLVHKNLLKAIMKCTKLKKANRTKLQDDFTKFKKRTQFGS